MDARVTLRPWWAGDAALALGIGVVQVVGTYLAGRRQPESVRYDLLAALLLAVGPAALFVRRRYPVAVLAAAFVATLAYTVLDYPHGPIFLSLIAAVLTVMLAGHRAVAWAFLGVGYVAFLLEGAVVRDEPGPGWVPAVALAAWLLVLGTVGEVLRVRRDRVAETARTREEEARRRAGEERMRIARELHDVLAHDISLINVQAGVALHLLEERPEQARTALAAIKQASKDALGELRSVLEVLRQADEGEPRAPTAGLDQLDRLVSGAAAAGLDVRVETDGTPRPLPPSVDLAAFRIVQEALTNVTRHAGPATATIRLGYGDRELTVQVDDDGQGPSGPWSGAAGPSGPWSGAAGPSGPRSGAAGPTSNGAASGSGSGIRGMKERAAALGGWLEAGPRPDGGFRIRASLPVRDDPR